MAAGGEGKAVAAKEKELNEASVKAAEKMRAAKTPEEKQQAQKEIEDLRASLNETRLQKASLVRTMMGQPDMQAANAGANAAMADINRRIEEMMASSEAGAAVLKARAQAVENMRKARISERAAAAPAAAAAPQK